MIRSLIIEDEKIAAESLKMLLAEVEPEIEVVAALLPVVQGDHKDHIAALGSCLLQYHLLVSGKIL